jgi:Lecithin retinol acyltransferase
VSSYASLAVNFVAGWCTKPVQLRVRNLNESERSGTSEVLQLCRGDHLRVWRGYFWHHGIYVGDDRVVQFRGGICDKPRARIEEVALADFRKGCTVDVVPKEQQWLGLWDVPSALPPEEIVARARWLAARRFEGTYNLVGRNCETIALWCVCNFGESLQRQRFQAVNAYVGVVILLTYAYFQGRGRGPSLGDPGDPSHHVRPGVAAGHVLPGQRALLPRRAPLLRRARRFPGVAGLGRRPRSVDARRGRRGHDARPPRYADADLGRAAAPHRLIPEAVTPSQTDRRPNGPGRSLKASGAGGRTVSFGNDLRSVAAVAERGALPIQGT